MRKRTVLSWILLVFMLFSVGVPTAFAEGTKSVTLGVAQVLPMNSMVFLPASTTGVKALKLVWTVADSSIVKIDASGRATGLKPGTTTAIATVKNNENLSTSFQVTVVSKVTGISFPIPVIDMKVGQKITPPYVISPASESKTPVTWASSDNSVAKITSTNGMITALKAGTALITATTKDGNNKATCSINVASTVTGILIPEPAFTMTIGEIHQIQASVLPLDATEKTLLYTVEPKDVVRIGKTGAVTALKEGTAKVTLVTKDGGFQGVSVITVTSDIDSVMIIDTNNSPISALNLRAGEAYTLRATKDLADPNSLKGYKLKWSSSDTAVVKISSKGMLQPLHAGTAQIRVEVTQDTASISASFPLTVTSTVTGLELGKYETTLSVGQSETLTYTILPETAFNKKVKWTSSDTKIVKVTGNRITGTGEGTANLTATTEDGGFQKICKVTVKSMTDGIQLPDASVSLPLGNTYTVTPVVMPATALIKTVNAVVSDKTGLVFKKSRDGAFEITGLKPGEFTITFTSTDGKKTAVLPITVVPQDLDVVIKDADGTLISKD